VNNVGDNGPSAPTGIAGLNIANCQVTNVGGATTTGEMVGIKGTGTVSNCTVASVGNIAVAFQVTGIDAETVSQCRMSSIFGKAGVTGITANSASSCSLESITQSAATNSVAMGIQALRISDCSVLNLSGSNSIFVSAFRDYSLASHCTTVSVSNSGTGRSAGFEPTTNSLTVDCVVDNAHSHGISGATGCVVRGCNVHLANTGIGIDVTGASGVAEGNTVANCTTGINVTGANGLIVKNRVTLCTTNIAASATSQVGPPVTATGTIASTNPWANFTD